MKGKRAVGIVIAGLAVFAAQPVLGAYVSIQHNLINGVDDTNYDPGSGLLTIDAVGGGLSLNDPINLVGTRSSVLVHLQTTFQTIQPDGDIVFNGGFYKLTFNFDPAPPGPIGGGVSSYEISGPIFAIELTVNVLTATTFNLDGSGLFTATTVNLPGSGDWPAAGFSTIDSLTLGFNGNASDWDPESEPLPGSRHETIYSLFPDDRGIPEPASLALLALGGLLVSRRRR